MQDTLVGLIQAGGRLDALSPGALARYVAVSARNRSITYLRRQRWERAHLIPLEEHWDLSADGPTPEGRLMAGEDCQQLRRIWPALSRRERQLLAGRYLRGYSDSQLARLLGCGRSSVRMLLTRARRRARALYGRS